MLQCVWTPISGTRLFASFRSGAVALRVEPGARAWFLAMRNIKEDPCQARRHGERFARVSRLLLLGKWMGGHHVSVSDPATRPSRVFFDRIKAGPVLVIPGPLSSLQDFCPGDPKIGPVHVSPRSNAQNITLTLLHPTPAFADKKKGCQE